jgi:uncharacterized heparinase superfamily protein
MIESVLRGARRILANLRPVKVPDAPARAFRDLWPGDGARGARLLRGEFEVAGTARPLLPETPAHWGPDAGSPAWRAAAHGFAWARDLRALGSDPARLRARALTADWLALPPGDPLAEAPEVTGARLSAWLGHWDFVAATAEDEFRRDIMARLVQDARGLAASLPAEAAHRGALVALKGAMAAAVALEEETWLARCVRFLPAELERQFLADGFHVERSPSQHFLALQDLIEIRNLLQGTGVEAPPSLAQAIDRAAPALRLMKHGDGSLALFNGTREEPASLIDVALTQSHARGRAPGSLPDSGFHRLAAHRTLVIVDAGAPPQARRDLAPGGLPRGADRLSHAGTLSFEMSVGRDRLVVNCGAAPAADAAWRDALRATAAHSTLILADTNSSELRPEGFGRRVEEARGTRSEDGGQQWLDTAHDGWLRPFGVRHLRRYYLSDTGDMLIGEDALEVEGDASLPAFAVRFHLHPDVAASLQQDEAGALLRLPTGQGWRLRATGVRVAIEESVYLGQSPRRSQQVVLLAEAGTERVNWQFQRVGAGTPE